MNYTDIPAVLLAAAALLRAAAILVRAMRPRPPVRERRLSKRRSEGAG